MNQSDVGHVFRFWSARATIRNVAAARKCGEPTAICGLWARCCRTVGQRCRTTTRKSYRPKIEALCYHGNCVNGRGARKIDKSLLGFRSAGKLLQYFLNNIKKRKKKKKNLDCLLQFRGTFIAEAQTEGVVVSSCALHVAFAVINITVHAEKCFMTNWNNDKLPLIQSCERLKW